VPDLDPRATAKSFMDGPGRNARIDPRNRAAGTRTRVLPGGGARGGNVAIGRGTKRINPGPGRAQKGHRTPGPR
jgi:hypothetical protein